ncbi:MAG: thioredoxin domain-containing protein [Prevotellaceae bacterium]|nr:thioredoxin domain-containing protein [Prevotellaceae bacterium]
MRRLLLLLPAALLLAGCKRTRIEGEWQGKDTIIYISQYRDFGWKVVDSLEAHSGKFSWSGRLTGRFVYGLSANPRDRHPAPFVADAPTLRIRLWENNQIATTPTEGNALLQRTLSGGFLADTLINRHPDSPVTAFMAARFLTASLPYDSLAALRKRLKLSHPYVRELDETLQAMRNVHPGSFAPPVEGIQLRDTTLLVFHATWCPDCQEEWRLVNAYLAKHPAVRLAALDIDSAHWDGDAAKAYAVRRVPTLYLIAGGKILPLPSCL